MKNTTLHLRTGDTITFSQRRYGVVVLVNGALYTSAASFWRECCDHWVAGGFGSADEFWQRLGVSLVCFFCGDPDPDACPHCAIARCYTCGITHDDRDLCQQAQRLARIEADLRDDPHVDARHRYLALKALAAAYDAKRRTVQ